MCLACAVAPDICSVPLHFKFIYIIHYLICYASVNISKSVIELTEIARIYMYTYNCFQLKVMTHRKTASDIQMRYWKTQPYPT